MTQIVLQGGILEKLQSLDGPVQLCDPSGQVVGEFRPRPQIVNKPPEGFEWPFTEEEIEEARRDPRRYTTEEVLQHLKSL